MNSIVFKPILEAKGVPLNIKSGVRITRSRMERLKAGKMVEYYWHSIVGTENGRSIDFANLLMENNLVRFENIMEEFRVKFGDDFLRNS